jgi:hypothetical protein
MQTTAKQLNRYTNKNYKTSTKQNSNEKTKPPYRAVYFFFFKAFSAFFLSFNFTIFFTSAAGNGF